MVRYSGEGELDGAKVTKGKKSGAQISSRSKEYIDVLNELSRS